MRYETGRNKVNYYGEERVEELKRMGGEDGEQERAR